MRRAAALALTFLLLPCLALAQADPAATARRAASQLDQAARELASARGARDRVAALTRTIRAFEEGLGALREGLRQASAREAAIRQRFDTEQVRLGQLIGVLQTMDSGPEALLLLHPSGAMGTARSGMILSDVTPALISEVDSLRADLSEITALRALQTGAADTLQQGITGIQEARSRLTAAMADRSDLPTRLTEDPAQMRRLADSATTLTDFAAALAGLPAQDASGNLPDFAAARGDLTLPVRGRLLAGFRQPDSAGIRRPGLLLSTMPGALVTSPWPATIRYRGPLLDYGNVMILEPGPGYLLVLGGLAQVYGETGDVIATDTPLGLMGGGGAPELAGFHPGTTVEDGNERRETLYMELREGPGPVDPAPWFRMDED